MVIDTHKGQSLQQLSPFGDAPLNSASVETQIEILNSENVALSVIQDLHLDKDEEFSSPRRSIFGTAAELAINLLTFWIPTADEHGPVHVRVYVIVGVAAHERRVSDVSEPPEAQACRIDIRHRD